MNIKRKGRLSRRKKPAFPKKRTPRGGGGKGERRREAAERTPKSLEENLPKGLTNRSGKEGGVEENGGGLGRVGKKPTESLNPDLSVARIGW